MNAQPANVISIAEELVLAERYRAMDRREQELKAELGQLRNDKAAIFKRIFSKEHQQASPTTINNGNHRSSRS